MESPSAESLSKLLLGAWIDNDVINTYCQLLQQHSVDVKIVDSFLFSKLRFHGVERARNSFKVTAAFNLLLVPVHCPTRQHWFLLAASFSDRRIACFDSALHHESASQALSVLKDFLLRVFPKSSEWNVYAARTPQQLNGHDCGPYTLYFAESLARRAPIDPISDTVRAQKLRIQLKDQLVTRQILPLATSRTDLNRPFAFMYPPVPNFSLSYYPPSSPPAAPMCLEVIDLSSPCSQDSSPPTCDKEVLSGTDPDPISPEVKEAMRRYLNRTEGKKRLYPFRLNFRRGKFQRIYPDEVKRLLERN
ncbi:unnamed protein product [Bemisia tabaci]|uniref:Ubiquitin-like protease family profile domain-containing protein n=1 Tax=Bemisia tabaci TaxID=7038 RepID=A0A9P0A5R3_BEMTA|nr:unnamed protein product [Bemisia tabaci]